MSSLNPNQTIFAVKNLKLATVNVDYFVWDTGYKNQIALSLRGAKNSDPSLLLKYVAGANAQPVFPENVKTFSVTPPESNMPSANAVFEYKESQIPCFTWSYGGSLTRNWQSTS
ncbi:MAG: hypothetical protein V4660_11215 [Pseudomonadota bacterium]